MAKTPTSTGSLILFLIGAGLGYYLDKTTNVYDHQLIVTPNFGSSDYLYAKVEQLNAKIKEEDTLFLKAIGIPTSMFTVIFAMSRTVGWISHWDEMLSEKGHKIGRPRQLYTGYTARDFTPLNKR